MIKFRLIIHGIVIIVFILFIFLGLVEYSVVFRFIIIFIELWVLWMY